MPLTKSAKGALKVDRRRKEENDLIRAKIKSAVKGARLSIATSSDNVAEKIQALYKELDMAAKKNVIHKNKAARLKSRITRSASKIESTTEKKIVKKAKKKPVKK